ncbi:Pyridoxine 5'-phosphate synthase [BD1-7 clade bacterium]|uniref:Pyridoxine 5'-phosphate synthase n=1 Tax=BD1-7 clade bacterium TaxID=2029982 RepID=A0A5S9QKW6_9GAMM|nr:Pyridoxine 5'-phosphate synthase [BD1-7 clade bacterium]
MISLSVNVNKIALIRNSRPGNNPDLLAHVHRCIASGVHGITVHPRPDQRHIRAEDCYQISEAIDLEFNIEGNPLAGAMASGQPDVGDYPGFVKLIEDIKPAQCTLVPDSNEQLTSDHGFDLSGDNTQLKELISHFKAQGSRVSLFMDADVRQIERAATIGADRVEFYTGPYADACVHSPAAGASVFNQYKKAAEVAIANGLEVNAGHDLNLDNLGQFKHLPGLLEVSIGHAIVVDALEYGIDETLRKYLDVIAL